MRALLPLLACISLPALGAGLNDTGIGFCGDASTITATCATVSADNGTYPRQDARYGRDAAAAAGQLTKIGGGEAGFDFTALNASGQPTTPTSGATPHPCVRDNFTGLVWEVKTADGGLRDQKWTYNWYDHVHIIPTSFASAGGNKAACKSSARCDTEKYAADVNATALCGFTDWRMPSVNELLGIVHFGHTNPAIDSTYFPNTPKSVFLSGSINASKNTYFQSFSVSFDNGRVVSYYSEISGSAFVRLVRGGQ